MIKIPLTSAGLSHAGFLAVPPCHTLPPCLPHRISRTSARRRCVRISCWTPSPLSLSGPSHLHVCCGNKGDYWSMIIWGAGRSQSSRGPIAEGLAASAPNTRSKLFSLYFDDNSSVNTQIRTSRWVLIPKRSTADLTVKKSPFKTVHAGEKVQKLFVCPQWKK